MVRVAIALFLLMVMPSAVRAEARFALLIGNQAYADGVGPLRNPHNDIALVGRALEQVGFSLLTPRRDASRDEMLFGVFELAGKLKKAGPGAIGFLYYTGHGIAAGGENILIPTNLQGTSDAELSIRGVRLAEVADILKNGAPDAVHFIVLDACRNSIRGQKGSKGFVPVTDQRTGVVLAFATAAGDTASDEGVTSGPYAAALADEIVKPGQNDQAVFNAVRARVSSTTNRRQTPWTHDGLIGDRIVFRAANETPRPDARALAYTQYIEAFEAGTPVLRSRLFAREDMGELAYSILETAVRRFQNKHWEGGAGWGTIDFDATGRTAAYTNDAAGQPGRILIQGVWSDGGRYAGARTRSAAIEPILVGEWSQQDVQGGFILKLSRDDVTVLWGPRFLRESRWQMVAATQPQPPPSQAAPTLPPAQNQWGTLDCRKIVAGASYEHRDTIHIRQGSARFRAIRLHLPDTGAKIISLTVSYPYATRRAGDTFSVQKFIQRGDRTGPFDLSGGAQMIDRVEVNVEGSATVCVEGLQ